MESNHKINHPNFVVRDTTIVNRLQLAQDFIHPEKVRLQLDKTVRSNPFDLGALAYTIRQPQPSTHLANLPYLVDESSFMPNRRKLLIKLHDSIITTGNKDSSIQNHINAYIRIITWFDTHGYSEAFENETKARDAYHAYVTELHHQLKSVELNTIIPKTANEKQRALIALLNLYWGRDTTQDIIRETPIIKFKRTDHDVTKKAKVQFATRTFLHLARGFKTFVMDNKQYPYLLKMSDYECYIFPSNDKACVTPYAKAEGMSYHYKEGRISTANEYLLKNPRIKGSEKAQKEYAKREIAKVQNNLIAVNSDPRNVNRLNYAALAMQSYMQLFILITGINPSELIQLEYDDSFTLEKDLLKNDFRAIKMRARGREVAYHLGNRYGLTVFKEYIQLRNWVLNGIDCPFLFFTFGRKGNHKGSFLQYRSTDVHRVYRNAIGKFFPLSFTAITARKVRKYKTVVWNELGIPQKDIAGSLNHDESTNHECYAVSSPEKQQEEFGIFFESTKAAAKIIVARIEIERIPMAVIPGSNNSNLGETKIGSGTCNDFKHPNAMEPEPPIPPDCTNQMGCLYCEHYVCHSDEQDIKKLFSLLYVIEAVRSMAIDFNHSDKLLLELTVRIQLVLTQMSAKSDDIKVLVESIKEEVMEHGLLTPFWEFRLQRYENMGVVIQ